MPNADRRNMLTGIATLSAIALAVGSLCYWLFQEQPMPIDPLTSRDTSRDDSTRMPKPEPPPNDFVGSQACAECHQSIVDAYQSHPMAHSLAEVHQAKPIESYQTDNEFQPAGPRKYVVEKLENKFIHHEIMSDEQGVIYDQPVEVHYALGSGIRGRSYLIKNGPMMTTSPITWYSGKQRWDLSPGYNPKFHPRFSRMVGDGCLMCHAGRTASDRDKPDTYHTPPFLEHAIGCERCHGPAGRHVAHHRAESEDRPADVIVNPSDLEIAQREAICNQCHLAGEHRILRYGRSNHDFRPGDRLEDIWTVFVTKHSENDGGATRAVSQVEQMRSSRCYQASEGRLGCTSCHDPHGTPRPQQKAVFYKQRCFSCHDDTSCAAPLAEQNRPPASGSCIACHLPRLPANDVPHTTQTDHRIVRNPQADRPQETELPPGLRAPAQLALFDDAEQRLNKLEVDRARGLQLLDAAKKSQDVRIARKIQKLLKPMLKVAPDDVVSLDAMAVTYVLLEDHEQAEQAWTQALKLHPENEAILTSLAILNHQRGDLESALKFVNRAIAVNPSSTEMIGRKAHILGQLGRADEAIKTAERAVATNPMVLQLYQWLAEAHEVQDAPQRSRHFQRLYDRIVAAMQPEAKQ